MRRILVESAWQDQRAPEMSKALRARNEGVEPEVRAIAWKAQHRLHSRLRKLLNRGKPANQAVTAVRGAGLFHLGDCPYGGVDGEVTGCFGESCY